MDRFEIGPCIITYDRDATLDSYSRIPQGGADDCDCQYCRNYILTRDKVFPPEFLALLIQLGIDFRKEAEVYHFARMENGRHLYGGSIYFVGEMRSIPDSKLDHDMSLCSESRRISFSIINGRSLAPQDEFGKQDLCEIRFEVEVPWLLNEPFVEE